MNNHGSQHHSSCNDFIKDKRGFDDRRQTLCQDFAFTLPSSHSKQPFGAIPLCHAKNSTAASAAMRAEHWLQLHIDCLVASECLVIRKRLKCHTLCSKGGWDTWRANCTAPVQYTATTHYKTVRHSGEDWLALYSFIQCQPGAMKWPWNATGRSKVT